MATEVDVKKLSQLINLNKKPYAVLASWTSYPIETVYAVWQLSKLNDFNKSPEQIHMFMKEDSAEGRRLQQEVLDIFSAVVSQAVPCAENINFTFFLYNDPIAHREQMVRHRVGHKFGQNYAVDVIPDLNGSSFWSQTMRGVRFEGLFDEQRFFTPESLAANTEALETYLETMYFLQEKYAALLEMGIPAEDARLILPLASTMNISWTLNLSSLLHVLGKRSCWILQYSFWSYFIRSMANELANKIHPIFNDIILPPCFTGRMGKKVFDLGACNLRHENEMRYTGQDIETPCLLYCANNYTTPQLAQFAKEYPEKWEQFFVRAPRYADLWRRNPISGKPLDASEVSRYKITDAEILVNS